MAIKSSGVSLLDVSIEDGYSVLHSNQFLNYLEKPDNDQDVYDQKLLSFLVDSKHKKPSMEAGFHAVLKSNYVAHTHSVFANVLTCSKEGKSILSNLFPKTLWINYATPGFKLVVKIKESLDAINQSPEIIFLQNHGLIISSNNPEKVIQTNLEINLKIIDYLNLKDFQIYNDMPDTAGYKLLFPDQAIYLSSVDKNDITTAALETYSAYDFILSNIKKSGLTPNFLSAIEAKTLINLESEKYRKKLEN